MAMELNDIASGFGISKVNDNFQKIEDWVNLNAVWRQAQDDRPNYMESALDMNGYPIINVYVDENNADSLLTLGVADSRYINKSGDSMQGSLGMGGNPLRVRVPQEDSEPVRKDTFEQNNGVQASKLAEESRKLRGAINSEAQARLEGDQQEKRERTSSDQSLQSQIAGATPVLSAERSPITWHTKDITNSVKIPDNVNAMSIGPDINIGEGVTIDVGEGSTWTIVDGNTINNLTMVRDEGRL